MDFSRHISFLLLLLLWVLACLGPLACFYYVVYCVVSWPFRWLERARLFLDVLAAGAKEGISPEQTVIALAERHEKAMGPQLHEVADRIRRGDRLAGALEAAPHLLPPQVLAMLRVGEEVGDLRLVLPAGRKVVEDDINKTRLIQDGVLATVSVTLLVALLLAALLGNSFFPRMRETALDLEMAFPVLPTLLLEHLGFWLIFQGVVLLLVLVGGFLYLGGPRQVEWLEAWLPGISGRVFHWLPWQYKRLQRDFAFMLGTLLDARVPEERAVTLAGQFAGSGFFRGRVDAVLADLRAGVWLPEAVRHLDELGEFQWRLTNAAYKPVAFTQSLGGWMESLDARAFQLEQAAGGGINVGLMLYAGLVAGLIAVSVFQFLTALVNLGASW